jgi:hypothetical protein
MAAEPPRGVMPRRATQQNCFAAYRGDRRCGASRTNLRLGSVHGLRRAVATRRHHGNGFRLARGGSWHRIVSGLSFPTAMTFNGNTLYISNNGFGQPTNTSGEIAKVLVTDTDD